MGIIVATVAVVLLAFVAAAGYGRNTDKAAAATPLPATPGTAASAAGGALAKERADGDLSVYYIGDSIADGYNASTQDKGYRPLTTAALGADGPVTESADYKAGATTSTVAGLAKLPSSVDVAVIELGTNDVYQATDMAAFTATYTDLAKKLGAASSQLVCVGVWPYATSADSYDQVIRTSCAAAGGLFVMIRDLYGGAGMITPKGTAAYPNTADGGHPSDAAHAQIASRLEKALQQG